MEDTTAQLNATKSKVRKDKSDLKDLQGVLNKADKDLTRLNATLFENKAN